MAERFPLLILSSPTPRICRNGEPVVIGIPLAPGKLLAPGELGILDASENRVPCDWTVLDRWPDGSARWVLLAFRAKADGSSAKFSVEATSRRQSPLTDAVVPQICARGNEQEVTIDTGQAIFALAPGEGWPLRRVSTNGEEWLGRGPNGLQITMLDGSSPQCEVLEVSLENVGTVRAVAACRAVVSLPAGKRLEIDWQFEFFAGLPVAIVHVTIRNPHRAIHRDGYWELGDPGSQYLREVAFRLTPNGPLAEVEALCSAESGRSLEMVGMPFELYQGSSGGDNWKSVNHIDRNGHIPVALRGYSCRGSLHTQGCRATPIIALDTNRGRLALASREFWQNFPKAMRMSESGISYGLFPEQWNEPHELQGGEQKTHVFAVSFGADGITDIPLDWFRRPLLPSLDSMWVHKSGAVPYLLPSDADMHPDYQKLVNSAIEGSDTFTKKRELIDEYGWRNFGDIYADHEAISCTEHSDSGPVVSHFNNQYDSIAGFCYQWLRSGDHRWWTQFNELAAHVVDIDIYHTAEDKSAYNHGLFWHTFHYIPAGRSTHRSYPRIGKSNGGGPANEHLYTTGLMLHYFITGNTSSRDAALALSHYVINIDDGSKTIFRWLARGHTGLASSSRTPDYHGPGRGSGNSLNALIDGHRLTSNPIFLQKAEELIRRVAHPQQDIPGLNLLDAENRWFYTIFLQSLGKYLDYKSGLGQFDAMYAYAQGTLLHFARWMAKHEYPFLEKPEILEYPTETWVAQDMRKSEVFKFAWLHSAGEERERFAERAHFFFSYVIKTLTGMETRSLCRPVVLLLSFGWMHAWFVRHPTARRPAPDQYPSKWPPFEKFVTQRESALHRARFIAAAGALACIAAGVGWAMGVFQ